MNVEKFAEALKIKSERDHLEAELHSLKGGRWNEVQIELKTGYCDMGSDITRRATFKDDVAMEICEAIDNIVKAHIARFEKQFNEL